MRQTQAYYSPTLAELARAYIRQFKGSRYEKRCEANRIRLFVRQKQTIAAFQLCEADIAEWIAHLGLNELIQPVTLQAWEAGAGRLLAYIELEKAKRLIAYESFVSHNHPKD